jgi:hypothetical protein
MPAALALSGSLGTRLAAPLGAQGTPGTTAPTVSPVQPGAPIPLKSFARTDVQGLFGGQSIWAAPDRTAYIQTVGHSPGKSGLGETRYKIKLSTQQWREIEQLVGAHHCAAAPVSPSRRRGLRRRIRLEMASAGL